MNDLHAELEHARSQAPRSSIDLQALRTAHERRVVRRKVGAASLALAITALLIVGAVALSSGRPGTSAPAEGGDRLPAPAMDLSLAECEYYFQQVVTNWGSSRSWWATDGSGRSDGEPANPYYDGTFGPGEFRSDSGPVASLSTDPDRLLDQLLARVEPGGASPEPYEDWGGDVTWGLVRSIGELLEAPDVSPEQKVALAQVAARLDRMTVTIGVADPLGRAAILLSIETEGLRHDWWFDPTSLQLLASGDAEPGEPASASWIVERAGVTGGFDPDLIRGFVPPVEAGTPPADAVAPQPSPTWPGAASATPQAEPAAEG